MSEKLDELQNKEKVEKKNKLNLPKKLRIKSRNRYSIKWNW